MATDLFDEDVFSVTFATGLKNMPGPGLYLAQARYLGHRLSDAHGITDFHIKPPGRDWVVIPRGGFRQDAVLPAQRTYFTDPVPETEVYQLYHATIDLSDFGVAPGEAVANLLIRGPARTSGTSKLGLDVVTVASLNAAADGGRQP